MGEGSENEKGSWSEERNKIIEQMITSFMQHEGSVSLEKVIVDIHQFKKKSELSLSRNLCSLL